MFDILGMAFMQRALVAGILLGVSCSVLGVFLVLRRLSLIGDGLAHVSFATVALGMLLGLSPVYVSVPLVILGSWLILHIAKRGSFDNDASIGLLSSTSVAVGVIIASVAGGFDVDLLSYLFGSILSVQTGDVILAAVLTVTILVSVFLLFHKLFALTYDEDFAKASGVNVELYNHILVTLTALTVVLGIRIVGTMLISSLIVIPAMTALQFKKGFGQTLILSLVFSLISVVSGIFMSALVVLPNNKSLPTGATIVVVNGMLFLISSIVNRRKS